MKSIVAVIAALIAVGVQAQAPTKYTVSSVTTGVHVGITTTNTAFTYPIPAQYGATVGLQIVTVLASPGTANLSFYLNDSVDGSTYSASGSRQTITFAATGTTTNTRTYIITNSPVGYLRLNGAANGNSSILHVVSVKSSVSPGTAAIPAGKYAVNNVITSVVGVEDSGTRTVSYSFPAHYNDTVGLQASVYLDNSGTDAISLLVAESVDGVNYSTTPRFTWVFPATGTSTNTVVTNITVGTAGYLRLVEIDNANGSSGFVYGVKASLAPGK